MKNDNTIIYYGDIPSLFGDITLGLWDENGMAHLCWLGFAGEDPAYRKGSSIDRMAAQYGPENLCHAGDKIAAFTAQYGLNSPEALLNTPHRRQPPCPIKIDHGTSAFQQRVWRGLQDIPAGDHWSYGQLARHIGQPRSIRAVASAVGKNPISLIVPCHRVTRNNGDIGHYGWGSDRKKEILEYERK